MTFKPLVKDAVLNGVLSLLQKSEYRLNLAGIAYLALAAPLFLMAVGFLAFATYTAIIPLYGQPLALFITGLGLLAITGLCSLIGIKILNKKKAQATYNKEDLALLIEAVLSDLENDVSDTVKSNPKMALTTAVITGFVAGNTLQK